MASTALTRKSEDEPKNKNDGNYENIRRKAINSTTCELIRCKETREFFKSFIFESKPKAKSCTIKLIECYEKCDIVLNDIYSYSYLSFDLLMSCPSPIWRHKITELFKQFRKIDKKDLIKRLRCILNNLQFDCICEIECLPDIGNFRDYMLEENNMNSYD